jgi:hypothetical protein
MRYGTYVMRFEGIMPVLLTWEKLAEMFQHPMVTIRAYCKKAMDYVRSNWVAEEVDLRLISEIIPEKKKVLIPLLIQRMVTS